MTHRSDQAVASQGKPAPQAVEPARRKPILAAWFTALAALAASVALVAFGLWLVRLPLAGFVIGAMLAERGAEADFRVTELGWTGATLADVRFGSEAAPDARIARASIDWRWRGLAPKLTGVTLVEPLLRLRIDQTGRISAGALDRLQGEPSRERPALPQIRLDIQDGHAEVTAPFGVVDAIFTSSGVLGEDFKGELTVEDATRATGAYQIVAGHLRVNLTSRNGALDANASASADRLLWNDVTLAALSISGNAQIPLDLARVNMSGRWRVDEARTPNIAGRDLGGSFRGFGAAERDALTLADWEGAGRIVAGELRAGGNTLDNASFDVRAAGRAGAGRGGWTLVGASLRNPILQSARPSASGGFVLAGAQGLQGQARVTLAGAHLTEAARHALRAAFPSLDGSPVGPAFEEARRALDAAANAFDLSIPLMHTAEEGGARAWVAGSAEAHARSGTSLRLSALRDDSPALTMAFPSLALHGTLALELSGGGAPNASLLLDAADWAPGAPFDADGTLTLANWNAQGSSIAAHELGVSLSITSANSGSVDLSGPLRLSGPVGDGAVRDLSTNLALSIVWSPNGWRATPRSACQTITVGVVEAAGLALAGGDLALCPLEGALIAANARGALSGGFSVRRLSLNGRMAGPGAQPARLSATNIVGRFRGAAGEASLEIEAQSPALAVDLSDQRTLALTLNHLSADARLAREWRVNGRFEQGLLTDPNLPGTVSAIEGRWSAAPEDGRPVVRVEAGEALLTANRPATDSERLLFNPLRLINTSGALRDGRIEAQGDVVLAENARQLARFTARHDVKSGAGDARVSADALVFGPDLQPYDITERARGLVENVRGPASIVGDIDWTNERIEARGHAALGGVSLSTSTIPIVENVSGEIIFDDLFALTTPPGQVVTVGLVNPGVAVRDGVVQFQLLPEQHVSIERAEFEFASGILSMQPATIVLGADETHLELALHNVEAADLISHLNIPDLQVTGRVEGRFPLLLTRRSAYISNGLLQSADGGGQIAYTGSASEGATGAARVAFDALRNFHYERLALTLDGDLSGDVVSSIRFRGKNTGRPVDLGPIAHMPGVGRVTVRGVPFVFNVTVTAPFRRLAQTVASITDPGAILDRAQEDQTAPPPVDQPGPAPR